MMYFIVAVAVRFIDPIIAILSLLSGWSVPKAWHPARAIIAIVVAGIGITLIVEAVLFALEPQRRVPVYVLLGSVVASGIWAAIGYGVKRWIAARRAKSGQPPSN